MLTSGEEVGWVVNITECQCAAGQDNCYHGILGDTIRGSNITKFIQLQKFIPIYKLL